MVPVYKCGHSEAELASAGLAKWGIKEVTYCLQRFPVGKNLTRKLAEAAVDKSWSNWQERCGLSFRRVESPTSANIIMSTGRGQRAGFDGKYGILAYCYLPVGDNFSGQLELNWDEDEPWTVDPSDVDGINFEAVTTHEGGHGIGLSHNRVANQLMNATYNPRIIKPQQYDTQDAQARYGLPLPVPTPTPTPTPTPVPGTDRIASKIQLPDGSVWGGYLTRLPSGLMAVDPNLPGLAQFPF